MIHAQKRNILKTSWPWMDLREFHTNTQNCTFWVAGGACRDTLSDIDRYNDIDIYPSDAPTRDQLEEFFKSRGYTVVFRCPQGQLISLQKKIYFNNLHYLHVSPAFPAQVEPEIRKIQLIFLRETQNPWDIVDDFDFTVSAAFWDPTDDTFYMRATNYKDLQAKLLRIQKLTYPLATLKRIQKYSTYGFRFNVETIEEFYTQLLLHAKTNDIQFDPINNQFIFPNELGRLYID